MTLSIRTVLAMLLAPTIIATGCGRSESPDGSCPTGERCGNTCVDIQSSPEHCGGCGVACTGGAICSQGACVPRCAQGQELCGGACVDTQSNPQHCGGCGNACTNGKVCEAGSCVLQCEAGQELCGGACVDTQSSSQHCGGCGNACPGGKVCRTGRCETPCPLGQVECSGSCIDMASDPQNCGACGSACNPGRTCSGGTCGGCQAGLTSCGQTCVDTTTDANNCGGCGSVCGAGQSCIQGSCRVPTSCTSSLVSPRTDAWGTSWDGLERVASTFAAARQSCENLGARLPTASELYRVNASRPENIGVTSANALWSLAPYSAASQHTIRLSDGASSTAANNTTTRLPYRCVCASSTPSFTGNACFGPPGQGCFAIKAGGGRYNMDRMDRPLLSKNGAVWECAFLHAHLADYAAYVSSIMEGLPNGSQAWLHTGDDARSSKDMLIKWSGTQPAWTAGSNTTASTLTSSRPFRCAGVNFAAGTHPNTVPGEYVGPLGGYKGEVSHPVQATWELAHDQCWNKGGHLPRSTELAELIQQGLPGGDGTWLWTSDQAGYNGTQFLSMCLKWSGTNPAFGYSSDLVTWAYKTASPPPQNPFRCIYYPLDPQYSGPAATACQGGCMRFQLTGNTPAIMWMDQQDRFDATLESAMASCANLGGRLASVRDYTEAIRHGLPNGSQKYLLSSDQTYDDRSTTDTPIPRVMIIQWSAINTGFNDQYPAYTTWAGLPTASSGKRPYRCMWTNELR